MTLNSLLTIARNDISRWRRMPLTAASAVIPPIAMMIILATLSLAVTQQPVALVVEGSGPESIRMAGIIESETGTYYLTVTNATTANALLQEQTVAAIITIPSSFDADVAKGKGKVLVNIDNTDFDFSDDIRRSVDRSVVEFDAPSLVSEELVNTSLPNVYHVALEEQYLRETNVDWFHYQLVPTFVLLILNIGLVGTAILCAQDEESKTARMLALSPQNSWVLVFGRILGGILVCFAIVIPAVLLTVVVGFVSLQLYELPALFAIFLGTALCASGTGAVIGTYVKGTRNVAFFSSIMATCLFLLGGGFAAVQFAPRWLQNLSVFTPTRYSIDGLRQVLFYPDPTGLPFVLSVLAVYAVACVAVGAFTMRHSWLEK